MNEVFLIGKVVSEIYFNFLIESKYISVASFYIKTVNKQIINIKAYDGLADFTYRKLAIGNLVFVYGKLEQDCAKARKLIIMK